MTTNSIKVRSVQFLGRDGWVQLSKVGGEGSRWNMPVAMECRSYSVTLDELLESRRARGEVIKRQSDEIERLRAVILDIARIVENPDSHAPRQVRDITDKESMRSVRDTDRKADE